MRILISSVGTRGDVQPAVALALQVRELGRDVRMCVPPNFTGWVTRLGFEARPIGIEMRAPRSGAPVVVPDLITDQFDVVGSAAEGCDLIVGGGAHQYAARSIAELRDIPYVDAVYAPVSIPTPDMPPPGTADASEDPSANLRLWADNKRRWNERSLARVNANRARLCLGPVDDVLGHALTNRPWLAADHTLAPAPLTPGMCVVQTGAWIMTDSSPLSPELEAFLDGEAPIYVGLGSMPAAEGTSRALIDAVRAVGRRTILSQGWAELGLIDDGPDCIAIGDVNHQALFPRVAAVIHHGGAGTTTAAAFAGTPQIVAPMFMDQFYWSRQVRRLGVGSSLPTADLDTEALALALHEALKPAVAARTGIVAKQVSSDGAATAARRLVKEYG